MTPKEQKKFIEDLKRILKTAITYELSVNTNYEYKSTPYGAKTVDENKAAITDIKIHILHMPK